MLTMSMQHIGDGPSCDKDYYDPVEEEIIRATEEIIRATSSRRNPNAAAWERGPGEARVAPDSETAPGSGGEESSCDQASGAHGPSQGEAAWLL